MQSDRELLELAARAAGLASDGLGGCFDMEQMAPWNPLNDDGDALRLAVKLRIDIDHGSPLDNSRYVCASCCGIEMVRDAVRAVEEFEDDVGVQRAYSTRRAIVRAAAELAKQEKPDAQQEPVMYQYRRTNPGDNKDVSKSDFDWHIVEVRHPADNIESRIEELESSRYNGKPCYEVRGLFAHHAPTQPAQEPCGYLDEFGNFEPAMLPWMQEEPGVTWAPVYKHPAPTQPALSETDMLKLYTKASGKHIKVKEDGLRRDIFRVMKAVEAHCRGGAKS